MKKLFEKVSPIFDVVLLPFVLASAVVLRFVREAGVHRLPLARGMLRRVGVFPVRRHYYEPQFDFSNTPHRNRGHRPLPGVDLNVDGQLATLEGLTYAEEIRAQSSDIVIEDGIAADFGKIYFAEGDSEMWYQLIRAKKPRRIIEIGSGASTLIAIHAIRKNAEDDPTYECEHICVEPYEMPWLEQTGIAVVRQRVEELDPTFFADLEANDFLFIDSSHVIRPDGDVLFEYLQLLPTLRSGVIVHVHDIFTPRNYPDQWITEEVRFWNEQYVLEAFLTQNDAWRVLAAVNYLHHDHTESLRSVCPLVSTTNEPGSFYLQRV